MERDFEKEFIDLKQSEVPDLWGRIEAGLTPKSTTSSEHTGVKQNIVQNVEMKEEQIAAAKPAISFEQKSGRSVRIYKWGLFAAACLCLLIVLPILSLTRSNSSSSDMAGAGAPAYESMEAPAVDDRFDMEAETASDAAENNGSEIQSAEGSMNGYSDAFEGAEAESDGTDAMDDSVSNSVTNGAEVSRSESVSAADSMLGDSDVQKDEMKELQGAKAVDWNDILQEGQLLHEVKIEVSEMIQSDSVNQIFTVRGVVASPDEDGFLYEGAELTLLCNEETAYDFVTKPRREIPLRIRETYIVDLRYEGNGDFVVVKIF